MIASDKLYQLLKHYEGCKLHAYKDSAGIWTIGYGATMFESGRRVKEGDVITQKEADELLPALVKKFEMAVTNFLTIPICDQFKFDALVSFAYNVGIGSLQTSTLLQKVKRNPNDPAIEKEFLKWNKARVKGVLTELKGLTYRRQSESWLYFHNEVKFFN